MKNIVKFGMIAIFALTIGCGSNKLKGEGNKFMEALKESDAETSFVMLDLSVQREVGGMEGWKTWIENRKPLKWEFTGFEVKTEGTGLLTGNADFSTGQTLDVELGFIKVEDNWKVTMVNFKSDK